MDPESGIHYYGGRYYDQNLSRFVSPDPFIQDPADPQNLNRYSYVLNSPQNYIDPSGFNWDYYFGGFSDFFSSFFQPSFQSQVQTAQSNNQFLSNTLFAGDSGWSGGTNAYHLEMTKYAVPRVEWDGMISGRGGNYSIFDGTKYEAGLGSVWFGNVDDFILSKAAFTGAKTAILAGAGVVSKISPKAIGELGETALKQLGGVSQKYFRTEQGARFVDQFVSTIAHEAKVGYQSLTKFLKTQIAKDVELRANKDISGSVWHFFKSPVTGKGGPSSCLRQALCDAGIQIEEITK